MTKKLPLFNKIQSLKQLIPLLFDPDKPHAEQPYLSVFDAMMLCQKGGFIDRLEKMACSAQKTHEKHASDDESAQFAYEDCLNIVQAVRALAESQEFFLSQYPWSENILCHLLPPQGEIASAVIVSLNDLEKTSIAERLQEFEKHFPGTRQLS